MNIKEKDLVAPFLELVNEFEHPTVLELGTRQSTPGNSTMHQSWIPKAACFVGTDYEEGLDVDILADVHKLSTILKKQTKFPKTYDIIISCSTFEHILNPFKAMEEIEKSLNSGGLFIVVTHNCFPIHAYPFDYWRYTIESLTHIVERTGLEVLEASYTFPCEIKSQRLDFTGLPNFLNVQLYARKK